MNYLSVKVSFDKSTKIKYSYEPMLDKNKELGKQLTHSFLSNNINVKNK